MDLEGISGSESGDQRGDSLQTKDVSQTTSVNYRRLTVERMKRERRGIFDHDPRKRHEMAMKIVEKRGQAPYEGIKLYVPNFLEEMTEMEHIQKLKALGFTWPDIAVAVNDVFKNGRRPKNLKTAYGVHTKKEERHGRSFDEKKDIPGLGKFSEMEYVHHLFENGNPPWKEIARKVNGIYHKNRDACTLKVSHNRVYSNKAQSDSTNSKTL